MERSTLDTEPARPAPSVTSDGAAVIEARALTRTFKGGIEAVRGIDLVVSPGEVFGFLGPNGAGKTTTVRMLCTLLPPTSGTARVAGFDVVADPDAVRHRIGVALQEIGLDPVQTGRELLELQSGLYGITGGRAKSRAGELLSLVGLTDAADRRTKTYSGGMKRRLERDQLPIGAISVSRPTLDDVFLQATGRRLEGQDGGSDPEGAGTR